MNIVNVFLMSAPAEGAKGGFPWPMILMLIVVFYFFMIMPQRKRAKKLKAFKEEITKGSVIVTTGGIHGKIVDILEDTYIIETEGHSKLKIQQSALSLEFTQALNKDVKEK